MSNSLNPVFGEWYVGRQLGNGTDGKAFTIYKEKYDGTRETFVMKILRLGENRNERKTFNLDGALEEEIQEGFDKIIAKIIKNIETVKKADNGKFFIKYENLELRNASDGKGKLILIKLEEGKSLAEVLKGFSFTLEETYRLGINICQALQKCRSFGYIYPNLKPENILFDRDGRCKIGDFGSFSCLEPAKTSISYKRTQYYMAPEFIKTGNINCTCDTYSLGLILYMLTNRGRLPFTEPYPQNETINSLNESVIRRQKGEELPKPALASESLWRIIRKACAFKPNDRYFTPEQMLSDLKNALNNQPFEEAKFEDVYSTSQPEDAEDESVVIPEVEKDIAKVEEEIDVISIKEEIQIPELPVFNHKINTARSITANDKKFEKLVDTKPNARFDFRGLKKVVMSALIATCLVLLFIVSAVLNVSAVFAEDVVFTSFAETETECESYLINEGALLYGS
ncbi:MAG: protein kinase [Clostridia bacterium]|nr:protein kinase [Clostridia bacterium]